MAACIRNNRGFWLLLEILLVLAIIYFLMYTAMNLYFKRSPTGDKIANPLGGLTASPSDYKDIPGKTVKQIDELTKQRLKGLEDLEKQLGQ